ncbi:MAG: hypothetical protein CSA33_09295 [Desulfobulbus propionicus]|nr:MAG: hypothetical protein CSA33_09295 [Desulfobulbus propionicus]
MRIEQRGIHRTCVALFWAGVFLCSAVAHAGSWPLQTVPPADWPKFADDLNYKHLIHGLSVNQRYLKKLPLDKKLSLGDRQVTVADLLLVNARLKDLVARQPASADLAQQMHNLFTVHCVKPTGRNLHERNILVTSYYQPVFGGRLRQDATFRYPLYQIPNTLAQRQDGQIGRLEQGTFVPFWTRGEIEQANRLAGQELVWLRDPFDAFLLHIQGSGLVRLADGSLRSLRYGHRNGHPYSSIGKFMVDSGRIRLEEAGLDQIRQYLHDHPEERQQILSYNRSYIFFRWSETMEAIGSMGEPVSSGRTVAADKSIYPLGTVGFLAARMPKMRHGRVAGFGEMQRFVLVQDTGSAIKGAARLDFFWGRGAEAASAAGRVRQQGVMYVLLPRS